MENKDDIIKKLHSGEAGQIAEALREIKTNGDISITPALFDALHSVEDHETVTEIINLLSDIKDSSFRQVLIARIEAAPSQEAKARLLRICWESSLDYSDYAELFAGILINDDFLAALEASTILEEIPPLNPERQHNIVEMLRHADVAEEKQFLINSTWEALLHKDEEEQV